ncbi:glycoside hydrolase family 2 TIM barrel-domain containing protein [Lewinella sp. IMCC34183]|uniref:glycoside hydrolase family 2 TIM barrel-domain containing protein n=1 Tax=Lewinella sp. IMCC34183 TaxID=2248762 RepID=UPI00130030AF|nr:glycoside hydrolase family 2 TIM barrel-domain containing protein [Lewinella sp. IMCC34183]
MSTLGPFLAGLAILATLLACGTSGTDSVTTGRVHLAFTDTTGYTLVRDGRAFTVRGVAGTGHLDLLKEYGGNTIRAYHPDSLANLLDKADRLGLAVIADLPLPRFRGESRGASAEMRALQDSLVGVVERFRNHPALLCWMVGNELFESGFDVDYLRAYTDVVAAVRLADPDHPVSTTLVPHQFVGIQLSRRSIGVDFLSFNVFGNFKTLEDLMFWSYPVWRGPYLISEWSYNGPWESQTTTWRAPLEPPGPTKTDHLRGRYERRVTASADHTRVLGSLAFYWGNKYERTPTWFSMFSETGEVSEMAFELGNLWRDRTTPFPGPRVNYLLLGGQGSNDEILLPAGRTMTATVDYRTPPDSSYSATWEVRGEDWLAAGEKGRGPEPLPGLFLETGSTAATFLTPRQPGPYRLYCYISDGRGYYSTANVPFYVLSSDRAK